MVHKNLLALLCILLMFSCSKDSNGEFGNNRNSVPSKINNRTLELYKGDAYISITHYDNSAAYINDRDNIAYEPQYAPTYSYSKTGSYSAKYVLNVTTWTYIPYYQYTSVH